MDRRRFTGHLLGLGAVAIGCSAGTRVREGDAGEDEVGTDTAPLACPPGVTGILEGQVLPDVAIDGYRSARGPFGPISLCEYWDPDGSNGINALLVIRSAEWCVPCRTYATQWKSAAPAYLRRGARILEVLVNGATNKLPATQATVDKWITDYGVVYDVARANVDVLGSKDSPVPTNFFVNPRTLKITRVVLGADPKALTASGSSPPLEAILAANGA